MLIVCFNELRPFSYKSYQNKLCNAYHITVGLNQARIILAAMSDDAASCQGFVMSVRGHSFVVQLCKLRLFSPTVHFKGDQINKCVNKCKHLSHVHRSLQGFQHGSHTIAKLEQHRALYHNKEDTSRFSACKFFDGQKRL